MNKTALKEFAINSRKDLISRIKLKLSLFFVDENFSIEKNGDVYELSNENHKFSLTEDEYKKRELLLKRINEVGLDKVIEEAAYTWFNRLIAIRYMEVNDFLPLGHDNESLGIRVLSSIDNKPDPEILKYSNLINSQLDINFSNAYYQTLNNDNEKFKYIIQLISNKLKKVIPIVFDGNTDYIDILIPENMLSETGFVSKILKEISEDDFKKVEIIGWLYQFYISERKDEVFADLKKNIKLNSSTIPAATQLFTPDWIVKYMIENTISNYIENLDEEKYKYRLKSSLKENISNINEFKIIDPCCGSGHILVYAFEVLFDLYVNLGFNKRDIAELILKNNIYGIDIKIGWISLAFSFLFGWPAVILIVLVFII